MLLPPLPDVYAQIDPAKRVAYWGINGAWTAGATIVPPQQADTEFGAPPGPGIFEAAVVTSGEVTMPINWTQIGTLIAGAKGKWSLTGGSVTAAAPATPGRFDLVLLLRWAWTGAEVIPVAPDGFVFVQPFRDTGARPTPPVRVRTGAPAFLGGRVRGGPVGGNAEDEAESLRQQYGLQPRSFARLRAATKAGLRR
jgi:hypothetical protein